MRSTTFLFALILTTAALLGGSLSTAQAGDPNKPGPNEVILHGDAFFGTGLAQRFELTPTMRQRGVYLRGQLLADNFRSVQVGSDVIASVYRSRPDRLQVGTQGLKLLTSKTSLDPIYDILIINRKSDGRADRGYADLPFRVSVLAEWKTTFGPGNLHIEEYFVAETAQHPKVHDLSRVLQPEDRGADSIVLHTGRYPADTIEVALFDQFGAAGSNARIFPAAPSKASSYSLWSFGFGDKARSLRLTWKGPEFGAKNTPTTPMLPIKDVALLVPDVKGFWQNALGMRYQVGTQGRKFAWKLAALGETGEGIFLNAVDVEVRWTAADGSQHGPVKGKVERDASWRATKFVFANGMVLTRAGAASKVPNPAANLSGAWSSSYGKVVLQHQGANIQGTLHYPTGGTASLKGTVKGQTITVTWFANPQAHGTGTFTISPDGKQLAGPFTDVVSKANAQWVLTR